MLQRPVAHYRRAAKAGRATVTTAVSVSGAERCVWKLIFWLFAGPAPGHRLHGRAGSIKTIKTIGFLNLYTLG
jgi:hypothetical protein